MTIVASSSWISSRAGRRGKEPRCRAAGLESGPWLTRHNGSERFWEELCALPPNQVGEIVGGELVASPRPAGPHSRVSSKLGGRLDGPFDAGEGGPGGWIILDEPELHLGDAVLVPDLAGWRRERMSHVPEELAAFELAPDWICEVLSASTSTLDRVRKMPIYAREGVQFAWLLEPIQRTLELFHF